MQVSQTRNLIIAVGLLGGVAVACTDRGPASASIPAPPPLAATVTISPATESSLVNKVHVGVMISDFVNHDDTLNRLAKAVQLFDANEQAVAFHETLTTLPSGSGGPPTDVIEIEPRAGPGWYTLVVWKVDVRGPGLDWVKGGGYWHDAGDRVYANYAVNVSSPGVASIDAMPAAGGGAQIGVEWSEPLPAFADPATTLTFFDASKQPIPCQTDAGYGRTTCSAAPSDLAYVRLDNPPTASSGQTAVFPPPGKIVALAPWRLPAADPSSVKWIPDRRGPPPDIGPPAEPPLGTTPAGGCGCSPSSGQGATGAFVLLALFAVRRLWRST